MCVYFTSIQFQLICDAGRGSSTPPMLEFIFEWAHGRIRADQLYNYTRPRQTISGALSLGEWHIRECFCVAFEHNTPRTLNFPNWQKSALENALMKKV